MNTEDWKHLDAVAKSIHDSVITYGPQTWQTALEVRRLMALNDLLPNVIWLCLVLFAIPFIIWGWKAAIKADSKSDTAFVIFPSIVSFAAMFILAIVVFNIANVWIWVGITYPELAIAHDLLHKVLK